MAGYQFIHYEAYARIGNKKKRSLSSIAREADRESTSHPHVKVPLKPEYLLGDSFSNAASLIVSAADKSYIRHGGKKRKLRKDANIGIGLVASHPIHLDELMKLTEGKRKQVLSDIKEWASDVITFTENEFPGLVQCAALHWDESYPHLHILIGRLEPSSDYEQLHKGEQARRKAQGNDRTSKGKKLGNDAYTKEMRRFQDMYFAEVSVLNGQARLGPGRRRLSRPEWLKEQAQAEALATVKKNAEQAHSQVQHENEKAKYQARLIVSAAREEAVAICAKTDAERKEALRVKKEAYEMLEKAAFERKRALETNQKNQQLKRVLNERIEKLSRYDGFLGRLLGIFGVRKRN